MILINCLKKPASFRKLLFRFWRSVEFAIGQFSTASGTNTWAGLNLRQCQLQELLLNLRDLQCRHREIINCSITSESRNAAGGKKQWPKLCREKNSIYKRNCQDHFRKMTCPFHSWKLAETQQRFWWKVLSGLSQPQTAWTTVSNRTQQKVRHLFHINFWGEQPQHATFRTPLLLPHSPSCMLQPIPHCCAPLLRCTHSLVQLLWKEHTRETTGVSLPLGSCRMK